MAIYDDGYRLYGAKMQPECAKVIAAFAYKSIPLDVITPSVAVIEKVVRKHIDENRVPVLITPNDRAIADSALMLRTLNEQYEEFSYYPETSRQNALCLLFELYADSFLSLAVDSVLSSKQKDVGQIGDLYADSTFNSLWQHKQKMVLPLIGVQAKTQLYFHKHLTKVLQSLDNHFLYQDFLFGNRPSAADFALYGQIKLLIEMKEFYGIVPRLSQQILAWVERIENPLPLGGEWLLDDFLPDTLWALFFHLDKGPANYLLSNINAMQLWVGQIRGQLELPDFIGEHQITLGGVRLLVATSTSLAWKTSELAGFWASLRTDSGFIEALGQSNLFKLINNNYKLPIISKNKLILEA